MNNLNELKQCFYDKYKYRSTFEVNFVMSQVNTMAAFIADNKTGSGIFAILDMNFNIIYYIHTNAYIHSCSISDNGEYAIFNTANSVSEDGGKCFFVDIKEKNILWKKALQENWKSIRKYYIDINQSTIDIIHDTYTVSYDFHGNIKNEEVFLEQKLKIDDYSPYQLKDEAIKIMDELSDKPLDNAKISRIISLLNAAENNPQMSKYQLSLAYKQLGELFLKNKIIDKAKVYFQKGLELNPKLPIKKLLKSFT